MDHAWDTKAAVVERLEQASPRMELPDQLQEEQQIDRPLSIEEIIKARDVACDELRNFRNSLTSSHDPLNSILGNNIAIKLIDRVSLTISWRAGMFKAIDSSNSEIARNAYGVANTKNSQATHLVGTISDDNEALRKFKTDLKAGLLLLQQSVSAEAASSGSETPELVSAQDAFIEGTHLVLTAFRDLITSCSTENTPTEPTTLPILSNCKLFWYLFFLHSWRQLLQDSSALG